jgi:hypothetical protein
MVCSRRTTRKSTGHQPVGPIAPRDVSPQHEPQHDSPQYVPQEEDPFEIVVMVPVEEDAQGATEEAQQQNNGNNDNSHEEEEEEGNNGEDGDDEDYTPLSDSEKDKMYRVLPHSTIYRGLSRNVGFTDALLGKAPKEHEKM